MSDIADWVQRLDRICTQPAPQHARSDRRIVTPGGALQMEGLLRFQPVGPIKRPGQLPEGLSVMSWLDTPAGSDDFRGQALAHRLAATLTLMTNRRFELLDEVPVKVDGSPTTLFVPLASAADRMLLGPISDTPGSGTALRSLLGQIAGLSEAASLPINAALDLHQAACLLVDRDITAAYTLLVAGLEALSRQFGQPPTEWSEWDRAAAWERIMQQIKLSVEQASAVRAELMRDRQLRLKATFVRYITHRLPDSFLDEAWQDWLPTIDADAGVITDGTWGEIKTMRQLMPDVRDLTKAIAKTYDARSSYVHEGKRTLDWLSNATRTVHPKSPNHPISFAVLRAILRRLLLREIEEHADPVQIPEIVQFLGDPGLTEPGS